MYRWWTATVTYVTNVLKSEFQIPRGGEKNESIGNQGLLDLVGVIAIL